MKKNVSGQVIGAQMISSADGSAFTGSVTVYVTVNGGTQAVGSVGSGACTHEGNGFHTYAPAQAETNGDHVAFTFVGSGAIPVTVQTYPSFPQTGDAFARLGAPAGASVSADVAAIQSDTNDIQSRLPAALVAGRMDVSVGAMEANTLTASALAADAVSEIAAGVSGGGSTALDSGTAQGGATATITLATGAASNDDLHIGNMIELTGGTGAGQSRVITDYNGTTKVATVDSNWVVQPDNTTTYAIRGQGLIGLTSAQVSAAVDSSNTATVVNSIVLDTVDIQSRLPSTLVGGRMDVSVGAMAANVVTASALATDAVNEIVDATWDELLSGHATAGTAGNALAAAGSAGDPWSTLLPGAYSAGTAGYIVGTYIDSAVSAAGTSIDAAGIRSAIGMASANMDTQLAAITAKTTNIPAAPAAVSDIPTAIQNADALLARDIGSGTNAGTSQERTVRSALRFIRNKWTVSGSTLTVTREDDATVAWTSTLSSTSGANPITGTDPT